MSIAIDTELHLKFHGRIIDQLGSQTYQSPVASMAELVANAWDADATKVNIQLPDKIADGAEITIEDNGIGLSFEECEDRYLNIGFCRRGKKAVVHTAGGRVVFGRKGIGKFAGFGMAQIICVDTVSKATGEKTSFEMNLAEMTGDSYMEKGGVLNAKRYGPDEGMKKDHGTKITLKKLSLKKMISKSQFPQSIARRFLIHQTADDFQIIIDGKPMPDVEEQAGVEFSFPKDYHENEVPEHMKQEDGWGIETLQNNREIKWKINFYKNTIGDEELQGITIFSNCKLSQKPFFFNLSGGLGGQAGQSYISGKVIADYVDQLTEDPMSAERQRINWNHEDTEPLLEWGQERVKKLLRLWHDRRGEKKQKLLEVKVGGFAERLNRLGKHEAKTVRKALEKLGRISEINDDTYKELAEALLTAWEMGRLRDLITDMSESDMLSPDKFLEMLIETKVISALNIAETIKTKIMAIEQLEELVKKRTLEKNIRDHLAKNPWILSQNWETFKIETSVNNVINEATGVVQAQKGGYNGRIDLTLSSGNQLIVVEFMRPELDLDWDHLSRFERYVLEIRTGIRVQTGLSFTNVTGVIVADGLSEESSLADKIQDLKENSMFAYSWKTLLDKAKSEYNDYMQILAKRGEGDVRMASLLEINQQNSE